MLYQRQVERGDNIYEFSYRQVNTDNLEEEENYNTLLELDLSSGRFEEIIYRPHRAWIPDFQHKLSNDESKMLVFVQSQAVNTDRDRYYAVKVLDDNMETIWEAEGIMKFDGRMRHPQVIFTNDGEVYLLVQIDKDPRRQKEKSELDKTKAIIQIKQGIGQYDLHLLDTENNHFNNCKIAYNADGNNFSLACIYADPSAPSSAISGLILGTYSRENFEKTNFSQVQFQVEMLEKVLPPRQARNRRGYNNLKLDDIFVRNGNEIVVVTERRQFTSGEYSSTLSNYEMNLWSFSASLQQNWHTVIPKRLESKTWGAGKYALLYDDDHIYVLYNEKAGNFSQTRQGDMKRLHFHDVDILTAAHINNQGQLTKHVAKNIPDKNEILLNLVEKTGDNQFLIFMKNEAFYRLGKIEF